MSSEHRILVLVGPTASGKTARAIDIAHKRNGVIINADAMQMYADLRVITARPTNEEMAQAEHKLYGVLDATVHGNAAMWCKMVIPEIEAAWRADKLPMLVGGTGMYIQSLMHGIAAIPPINDFIRSQVQDDPYPYQSLQVIDPIMAARLEAGDIQRVRRALEVFRATGKSLSVWQQDTHPAFPYATYEPYAILPDREILYDRINKRFEAMMEQGAMEEVRRLLLRIDGDASLPILKAHGVPELIAHIYGQIPLEEAIAQSQQHTRNYAKRQMTWIRGQMPDATIL